GGLGGPPPTPSPGGGGCTGCRHARNMRPGRRPAEPPPPGEGGHTRSGSRGGPPPPAYGRARRAACVILLSLALAGGCRRGGQETGGPQVITVCHPWAATMAPRFARILAAFERAHPGIRVRAVFTPNNLAANQKFFTAVAAGTPPDVV